MIDISEIQRANNTLKMISVKGESVTILADVMRYLDGLIEREMNTPKEDDK